MSDLGNKLKRAREERGVSLREMATATKISVTALEALERNEYSRLPGGIFSRSFVRAYASAVGLDPDATVNEFLVELTKSEREAERAARARRPEISQDDRAFLERQRRAIRTLRATLVIVAVVGVSFLVYEGWSWWRSRTAPAPQAPPAPAKVPPPGAEPAGLPAPAEPAPSPPQGDRLAVALAFTADCWTNIMVDGSVVLNRIVKAGERQALDAEREVVLDVGDAGAFTWTINGRLARPLGKPGTHERARVTRDNAAGYLQ